MASRYLSAGYSVYGEARSREGLEHLLDEGLSWCDTPRELAQSADIVITSIPNDDVLREIASGDDGIKAGLEDGKIWVDMSTVSPRVSREVAEQVRATGALMLDAPVSGSVPQVQSGTLTIMVGGDRHAYDRVEAVLEELGYADLHRRERPGPRSQAGDQHQPGRADARLLGGAAAGRARWRGHEARRRRDDREPDRLADAEGAGATGARAPAMPGSTSASWTRTSGSPSTSAASSRAAGLGARRRRGADEGKELGYEGNATSPRSFRSSGSERHEPS